MKNRFRAGRLLSLAIVLILGSCSRPMQPTAENGVMDLREWDFDQDGSVKLNGSWKIYWDRLLEPSEIASGVESDGLSFSMPHTWNDWEIAGESVGGMGHATFVLEIRLPDDVRSVGFAVPDASTAYTLWANGVEISSSGTPGPSAEESIPHYRMRTAVAGVEDRKAVLVLQVSNYHHRRGGMWKPIRIGTPDQIESYDTMENLYDFLLLGSFLALGLYNFLLYFSTAGRPRANILLSLMFWILCVRVLVLGQMLMTQVFPGFPWVWQLKIEYFTSQAIPLLILWVVAMILPGVWKRGFTIGFSAFVGLNTLFMICVPVRVYSQVILWYLVVILLVLGYATLRSVIMFFRGERWALAVAAALGMMVLIIFGETTHYRELILSRDFGPFLALLEFFPRKGRSSGSLYFWSVGATLALLFLAMNFLVVAASRMTLRLQSRNESGSFDRFPFERYKITKREKEILGLVVEGLSNKEIGGKLFISEGTVKNHVYSVMQKIGCRNRTELASRIHNPEEP